MQLLCSKQRRVIFPVVHRMTPGLFIYANKHKQHAAGDDDDVTRHKVIMGTSGPDYICQSHTHAVKTNTIIYWEKGVTQTEDVNMSR